MSQAKYSEHVPPLAGCRRRSASFRNRLRGAGTVARRAWRDAFVRRLVIFGRRCALVAAGGWAAWSGFGPANPWRRAVSLGLSLAIPSVWVLAMLASGSYEEHFLWEGPEEFRRVLLAAALLLAARRHVSWGLELAVARGFVVVALPLATALTLAQRLAQRVWLRRQRAKGRFLQTTLLVGRREGVVGPAPAAAPRSRSTATG